MEHTTIESVFAFIDTLHIKTVDALELKSRIDDMVQGEREKAIDEFVDKLYQDYVYDSICRDDISFYGFGNKIKSIAEQMKGGVK